MFFLICLSSLDFWVCKSEAAHIIQAYANQMNIICLCDASENIGLTVYYFTATMTPFKDLCTTEAIINDIIHKKCTSGTITVPTDVNATVMNEHFQKLEESCLQTSIKDTIMMIRQTNRLLLFGLTYSVKSIIAEHEKLKPKLVIARIELNLQYYQVCVTHLASYAVFNGIFEYCHIHNEIFLD